jgi:xanthine dehydrogenase accessory factor
MTHEFIEIIEGYQTAKIKGRKSILVTLVFLEGSSYRPPGVRMLINSDGSMIGAVSGGCVEKEILKQSDAVFNTKVPRIMTYDGRYRLGCEGLLYLLLEPFDPSDLFLLEFEKNIIQEKVFELKTYYHREVGAHRGLGSEITLENGIKYNLNGASKVFNTKNEVLVKLMKPSFKLVIFGGEHDASQLCKMASFLGWHVTVVVSISNLQSIKDFPGAKEILHLEPAAIYSFKIPKNSAIILMTHSYVRDLNYLSYLKELSMSYIGLLGPKKRREKLLNAFIELHPDIDGLFLDIIHGPAGLNIGAETPQEIALSICSEILSVIRNKEPIFLSDKENAIHCKTS